MTVSSRSRRSAIGSRQPAGERRSARSTGDSGLPTTDDRLPTAARAAASIIERVRPEIDGGRFPIKRTIGERVDVTADIFADGHDVIVAVLRDRRASASRIANRESRASPNPDRAVGRDGARRR